MKITLTKQNTVEIVRPALDENGEPRRDAAGNELGTAHTLSLEQYEKHARDPEFIAAVGAAEHALVLAAVKAAKKGK